MRRLAQFCVATVSCLALFTCATPPPPPPPAEIWPTAAWPTSTPEAQGIDSGLLADAIDELRASKVPIHSLLVERNGYIVLDAYFFPFANNEPHDVASITKSVTSTLVGVAIGDKAPLDVSAPVASLFPNEMVVDPRMANVTLSQLLSMTSGIDCTPVEGRSLLAQMESTSHWSSFVLDRPLAADPGSRFNYCAGNAQLVSASLTKATGKSASELAREELFAPLGITDVTWPSDPDGISHGFADLRLEPRDLAKLGYLWLHNGRWDTKQVVPADYVKSALTSHADVMPGIEYGYGMWLYPGHEPYEFQANGRGGQRITVIPSLNAVVVVTGGGMDANIVDPWVARAFRSNAPLPEDKPAQDRLERTLARIAAPPPAVVAQTSPSAAYYSGRTYYLPPNPLGVETLTLNFPVTGDAFVHFGFADGTSEDHPIGMEGAPLLSQNIASGLPVAVAGSWSNGSFVLDYDEIARINAYRLVMTPAGAGLSIHLTERSGLANMMLTATDAPPVQNLAGLSAHHG